MIVEPPEIGLAQGGLLDATLDVFALDEIADAHLAAQHDQHACEEVLEDVAECKADRHRAETEDGDQTASVHPGHDDGERDQYPKDPGENPGKRHEQGGEARAEFRSRRDSSDGASHQMCHRPGDKQDGDRDSDLRKRPDEPGEHLLDALDEDLNQVHRVNLRTAEC